ncbi:hypothetical protein [Luteipulveratus halotolerans]|uniref:DUF8175 domain-containing protein n=1 Tax=Luteipulveratus halotolerans TaxID=1631356 RepID=A0A0L6CQ81_9MICO|nr:hypothetical protein [Luteipulveratus halotolerans]KNX39698.1 hypothetical protein VV01_00230 [Luteipulveratus halotolerans]
MRLGRSGNEKDNEDPKPAASGYGRAWTVSAGVLALVVLMGIGGGVARFLADDDPQEAVQPATTTSAPAPAPGATPGGTAGPCPNAPTGRDGGSELPVAAPKTTWDQFGGGALLVPSTDAGPMVRTDTLRRCYAHTPLGAFTSATNTVMGINGTPAVATVMLQNQLTPGPARDRYLKAPGGTDANTARQFRVVGARVLSYTPARALTEVVMDLGGMDGVQVTITAPMVWSGGDWKLDGTDTTQPRRSTSLDGFVRWEAGR